MPDDWTCRCIDRTGLLGANPQDTLTQRFEHHLAEVQEWRAGEAEEFCLLSCKEEDPQLALALLNSALSQDPHMTEALLLRALRYEKLGEFEKMKVDALQAIELRKGGDLAHGVLGTAQYLLKQYVDANKTLTEAIQRNPRNVLWWYDRAVVKGYMGKFEESLSDANTAIGINSKYAFAYVARAIAQVGLKNSGAAMEDFNHAERLDPRIIDIFIQRCELFLLSGQFDKAMADANRAVKLNPRNAAGYQRRAHAYILSKRYDEALEPINKCLEMNPEDAISLLLKGIVHCRAGANEAALAALDQALKINPTDPRVLQYRAKALLRLGRNQEAIASYSRWIDLSPSDSYALMKRGMVYEMIGESRLALSDYDRAANLSGAVREYSDLWSFLLCKLEGDDGGAANYLGDRVEDDALVGTTATWTQRLFAFVTDRIEFVELLDASSGSSETIEAYYYGGVKAQLEGDREEAIRRFTESAARNHDDVVEGDFAVARLRAMNVVFTPDQSPPDSQSVPEGGISQPK